MMNRKLAWVLWGVAVVSIVAVGQAGATVITVDDSDWTMTMKYDSAEVSSGGVPTTVDYNLDGTEYNDVAMSTYTNTLTGGIDAI